LPDYNDILSQNSLLKCRQAFDDAAYGLKDNRINIVLNRLYYAIFYAVQALGYKEGFATSKHSHLMGWFNKKYIYQDKIFPVRMGKIYKDAFINRQESDYELLTASEFNDEQINSAFSDCEFFLRSVFEHLKEPF